MTDFIGTIADDEEVLVDESSESDDDVSYQIVYEYFKIQQNWFLTVNRAIL